MLRAVNLRMSSRNPEAAAALRIGRSRAWLPDTAVSAKRLIRPAEGEKVRDPAVGNIKIDYRQQPEGIDNQSRRYVFFHGGAGRLVHAAGMPDLVQTFHQVFLFYQVD